jgi:ERCC4-type nuclease
LDNENLPQLDENLNENFPLFVDPRVGSVDLVKYLKVPVEVTKLRFGDVAFSGYGPEGIVSIGIERKNIRDLVSSMDSGRLSGHQLIGLLDFYHVVYVVVEGIWRVHNGFIEVLAGRNMWRPLGGNRQRQYSYAEIANFLNTLAIITNVRIWFTDTDAQTGDWIRHTYFWWQKRWDEHRAHLNFQKAPDMPKHMRIIRPSLIQRMAKELPGVGWERAGELAKAFVCMEDLMAATPEDFIKLPGIGAKLAKNIYEDLHKK